MSFTSWQRPKWMPRMLALPLPEPKEQAARILSVQRNIVLPARGMVTVVVLYYLFYSHWLAEAETPRRAAFDTLQHFFIFYLIIGATSAILLILKRLPPRMVQWVVFIMGLLDGLLLTGLTIETGGFDSDLYWVFPGLIVLNALSIPLATPQIVLNLGLSALYLSAGLVDAGLRLGDTIPQAPQPRKPPIFTTSDIRDLPAFVVRLTNHTDPFAQFLWARLSISTRQGMLEFSPASQTQGALAGGLVSDLNDLVSRGPIYTEARFSGVALSEETKQAQLETKLSGDRLTKLNRLLVEDACPNELVRKPPVKIPPEQMKKILKQLMRVLGGEPLEASTEPFILRLIILWLLAASCYGVQLLAFRDRQAEQEAREAAARNSELKTAGRLAAEIAHQLKNPLGIINNAAFSIQRGLRDGRRDLSEQIEIIREEVERSDRIITQLMGYAQLCEGRVERLNVTDELERALAEALPPAAHYPIDVQRDYGENLPALTMQRSHLGMILVNLLQNAREAIKGTGNISVSAQAQGENGVEIVIADDGPGIAAENLNRIFEAYFTNKEKGTGLGLAIVKHNVELYGGTIRAESKLGKGARFVLLFPARIFVS